MKKQTLRRILSLVCILALVLSVPVTASAAEDNVLADYILKHDPRLNEKAMADIVVDPTAVYGFAPSPTGSLAAYASFDWSDPELVNGEHGRLERIAYHESLGEMYDLLDEMTSTGESVETIARTLSAKRNELRLAAYDGDPEGLAAVKERNLAKYGHEEGPLPDELYAQYGSWETVIEKAFSVNAGMDACLGLYDEYFPLYVITGQTEYETLMNATREYAVTLLTEARPDLFPAADPSLLDAFTDADKISDWAKPALAAAVSAGLIKGYEDGTIRPKAEVSTLEALVLLSRSMPELPAVTNRLPDLNGCPEWAMEDILHLVRGSFVVSLGEALTNNGPLDVPFCRLLAYYAANPTEVLPLYSWTADAQASNALYEYVASVTDLNSEDYIPEVDRIAVFDLDGTLFCETDPNYFDYTLLAWRVLEDPDYKDRASDFEREVALKIKEQNETGASFKGLEVDHGKAVASAFAGMTVEEFNEYIQEFKQLSMPGYKGMLRGEGFYQPMLQVVNYLIDNGFTCYIVSGTDRLIVRGIVYASPLSGRIPNRQIIGSDELIIASNQGDEDGLNYVFTDGEELILAGEFLIKNLKMNKVAVIMQEIGQQPVLSFGNSTGDSSMAEYVTSGNPYKSLAFMLCCDDVERENGNEAKAQKMFDLCEEFDWVPISMKNDWTTIYGDGVTYVGAAKAEAGAEVPAESAPVSPYTLPRKAG